MSVPVLRRRWLAGALATLALGLLAPPLWAADDDFRLIVQRDVPLSQLSKNELRAIFALRTRQFADGTPITLLVLPDQDPRHRDFAAQVLNVFPYVLRDNWNKKTFTGAARPPITANSPDELARQVAATPGGMGYLPGKDKTAIQGIKYVDIN